ncbi:MAG: UbiA family prenyltransferase [Tepidisphaerales bacterium]
MSESVHGFPAATRAGPPLFVDLDGTLIRTDVLYESAALAVRRSPAVLLQMPMWLMLGGRARLKRELAGRTVDVFDPATLPYVPEVLAWLREERSAGTHIVLATAGHRLLAEKVAAELGLFDAVLATDGENLKGGRKLEAIRAYLRDRGLGEAFRYAGDSAADRVLFAAASGYVVVGGRRFSGLPTAPAAVLDRDRGGLRPLVRLLRPHQWTKNVLLLVPAVAGQKVLDPHVLAMSLVGVFVFSLLASATYIANDLLDMTADRLHPRKRLRPLAQGLVSVPAAVGTAAALLAAAVLALLLTPVPFMLLAAVYLLAATAYSTDLKRRVLVDVLCLAGLYTLRILAGGAVTGIVVSPWLLAFSMFVFLSLAFVKRYTELTVTAGALGTGPEAMLAGRGYRPGDLDLLRSAGPAAGYVATLVLALYVSAPEVSQRYASPGYLYALCPLALYWLTRVWFLAHRQQLHDDPVVFALRDRNSHIVLLLAVMVLLAAKFL